MITLHCRPADVPPTEVCIGRALAPQIAARVGSRRAFLFHDPRVPGASDLGPWPRLAHAGGEAGKTLAGCETLLRAMVAAGLDRGSLLLAVGGGVVGDLGGLAASLFLRGIEFWQVPTTLLAMVDSAVGGKTAVNLPEGKNLAGTVHPARLALVDVDWLATLPQAEFRSGLAEVIKTAIGLDGELFELLEREPARLAARDPDLLLDVVRRSIAAKIAVVEADPREHGRRRLLNLGHTLGHALEAHADFGVPHGLCVARGLHFALTLAEQLAAIPAAAVTRARELLLRHGFARHPLPPDTELLPYVARDKKVADGLLQFALPTGIGSSEVRPLPLDAVTDALRAEVRAVT